MIGEVLIKILGCIEISVWMWGICQAEFKKRKIVLAYGIFPILATFFLTWLKFRFEQEMSIYFSSAITVIHIIFNSLIFQGKFAQNIIKSLFSTVYLNAVYFPIKVFFSLFKLDKFYIIFRYESELISIATICIVFLIGSQIKKHKKWVRWIQNMPTGYFFIGFLFAFSAGGISVYTSYSSNLLNREVQILMQVLQLILSFFLYSFGIAIAFIDLLKENYRRESILKDKYLKNSKEHYQNLKDHIAEVQKIRHDMKNHHQLLETYIEQRDWEKAHNYLKEIENHQQWNYKPLVNIGNDIVNAVLNSGLENIDPKIVFKVEGVLPPTLEIQEYDLCTIFSNLLSNSIEACEKLREHEKIILLSIRTFQNQMFLSFKNPIEEDIKTEDLGKYSTKGDKFHHGYGIRNIIDAVERYGGTADFLAEDNWFEVKICLYLTTYS